MDEVDRLCDRILIMDRGRAITTGTPTEVMKSAGKENLEEAYLAHLGLEACDASYLDAV
jgi:ABC-type Na+ transport system ATPase subunit NatA